VLSQLQDGQERVVKNYSMAPIGAEKNYCLTRRELLACVKTLKLFHMYLQLQEFQIRTEHSALIKLLVFRSLERQPALWVQSLQEYSLSFKHRHGQKQRTQMHSVGNHVKRNAPTARRSNDG
jgi:hypothetical protein